MKYILALFKTAIVVLFIVATGEENTHEFYQLLGWIVLGSFAYFAWNSYQQKNGGFVIIFILGALLFNPFKATGFEEETWKKVDYIFALLVAFSILFDFGNTSSLFKRGTSNQIVISKSVFRREKKIFAGFIGIMAVIWIFVQLTTVYYQKKISRYDDEKIQLKVQIDALPTTYVWELYNEFKKRLQEKYTVGQDTFLVRENQNLKFLQDYPNAIKQDQSSNGYQYYYPIGNRYVYTGHTLDEIASLRLEREANKADYLRRYNSGKEKEKEITDPVLLFDLENGTRLDPETNEPKPELLLYTVSYYQFQSNLQRDDYKDAVKYYRSNYLISNDVIEKGLGYSTETVKQEQALQKELANISSEQHECRMQLEGDRGQMAYLVIIILYVSRIVFLFAKRAVKNVKAPIKIET